MAPSQCDRFATPEEANATMRAASRDILETIAKTREVLRQSREAMANVSRLLDGNPEGTAGPSNS